MFPANQVMKFCIGGENLDTKLQVLRLPKTFQVSVYNNVRYIHSGESSMIIRYVPAHGHKAVKAENNSV